MAERRMFAKSIVLSDAFLDMPLSTRCLYFTLGMFADDDGFVGSPKGIIRQCGASNDDMKLLLTKRFVLVFESGVIVIKHWRMNNYLQKDRHKQTTYTEELAQLAIDDKGAYTELNRTQKGQCIQNVYKAYTQDRLGKDSLDKASAYTDKTDNETQELKRNNQHESVFKLYQENIGFLTQIIGERIKTLVDEVGELKVKEAITEAATHNARNLAYIEAVARCTKPKPPKVNEMPGAERVGGCNLSQDEIDERMAQIKEEEEKYARECAEEMANNPQMKEWKKKFFKGGKEK